MSPRFGHCLPVQRPALLESDSAHVPRRTCASCGVSGAKFVQLRLQFVEGVGLSLQHGWAVKFVSELELPMNTTYFQLPARQRQCEMPQDLAVLPMLPAQPQPTIEAEDALHDLLCSAVEILKAPEPFT